MVHPFLKYNAIGHLVDYSVDITFICTEKPKKIHMTCFTDIYFIVVVWNQICNISQICLYTMEYYSGNKKLKS